MDLLEYLEDMQSKFFPHVGVVIHLKISTYNYASSSFKTLGFGAMIK
jgi:hypothetical protein